jgi:glycosyltransferase involved in cell wall biosynthesis
MPKVTVVMPAFNAARYIGQALASIHAQTLKDVEVIVVDDGSTDETIKEAERFGRLLDLTIIRQTNAGPSAARNLGIRRAGGPYCALLDADDIMLPELLAAQAEVLDADRSVGLVVTDVTTFNGDGIVHEQRWNLQETDDGAILERLLFENFVTTSAVMAPADRLKEAGLFNIERRVAEDYELWLRLAARWKVAVINRPLVRYRYSPGSLSDDRLYSSECALEVVEQFLREHPAYLRDRPGVRRRAIARHMTNAAAAALAQGRRRTALAYLLRSVYRDRAARKSWKYLAKTLLPHSVRRAQRPARSAEAV